jgi:hypothetical protein
MYNVFAQPPQKARHRGQPQPGEIERILAVFVERIEEIMDAGLNLGRKDTVEFIRSGRRERRDVYSLKVS